MNTHSLSIALVEDNPKFRALVRETLAGADLALCAELPDGESAIKELPAIKPEVVLMDIGLPGVSGVECVRELLDRLPSTQVMMLTVFEDYERVFHSLVAGAKGYLVKKGVASKLVPAIHAMYSGVLQLSPSISRKALQVFDQASKQDLPLEGLSLREHEVLQLMARGRRYKEIAQALGVSEGTVRTHVNKIFEKLRVNSKTEAVRRLLGERTARPAH